MALTSVLEPCVNLFGRVPRTTQPRKDVAANPRSGRKTRRGPCRFRKPLRNRRQLYPAEHRRCWKTGAGPAAGLACMWAGNRREGVAPLFRPSIRQLYGRGRGGSTPLDRVKVEEDGYYLMRDDKRPPAFPAIPHPSFKSKSAPN